MEEDKIINVQIIPNKEYWYESYDKREDGTTLVSYVFIDAIIIYTYGDGAICVAGINYQLDSESDGICKIEELHPLEYNYLTMERFNE